MRDRRGAGTAPITMEVRTTEVRTTLRTVLDGTGIVIGGVGRGLHVPIPPITILHRITTGPTTVRRITGDTTRLATIIGPSPKPIEDYGYGGKPEFGFAPFVFLLLTYNTLSALAPVKVDA